MGAGIVFGGLGKVFDSGQVFGPEEDEPPVTELGLAALAGLLGIVGEPMPAPPSRLAGHQVAYSAGLAACTALLAALAAGGEETVAKRHLIMLRALHYVGLLKCC